LIKFGQHPQYRIWKGPQPTDDSDEEWATHVRRCTKSIILQLDEGVHMETMLEHLLQLALEMDRAQQTKTN